MKSNPLTTVREGLLAHQGHPVRMFSVHGSSSQSRSKTPRKVVSELQLPALNNKSGCQFLLSVPPTYTFIREGKVHIGYGGWGWEGRGGAGPPPGSACPSTTKTSYTHSDTHEETSSHTHTHTQ